MEDITEEINKLNIKQLNSYFNSFEIKKLKKLREYYSDLYYNTDQSSIEDWQYDILEDVIKTKDPDFILPIGVKVRKSDNSISLPYFLGSANKFTIREKTSIEKWKKTNKSTSYMISDKLDGISGLLTITDGLYKLYTRGDGFTGKDISHFIPYIRNIPKNIKKNINIRGELIVTKKVFDKKYRDKIVNSKSYRSARNMVAGTMNSKTSREPLNDINFVSYEIVENNPDKISDQFNILSELGFAVANHQLIKTFNYSDLEKILLDFKQKSDYEIDGIIVTRNTKYDRSTNSNPDYMFAFKMRMDENIFTTTVKHVEWNVSKWHKIIPVVVFEPIILPDATLSRATQNNAKYIKERKIGPGTIIKVTRSNDVIPYIVEVVKSTKAQMPDIKWKWDDNKVHIIATGDDLSSETCVLLLANFFKKMNIKHVSEQTISKIYNAGYNNLIKILKMTHKQLTNIPGLGVSSAKRIYSNIHNGMQNINMAYMLGASGIFGEGIGTKQLEKLFHSYPNILEDVIIKDEEYVLDKISKIPGFGKISISKILKNLPLAILFIEKINPFVTFKEEEIISSKLLGKSFVFTEFRDKELEQKIINNNGKVSSSVSKNTYALVVKNDNIKNKLISIKKTYKTETGLTAKEKKALELNIHILSANDIRDL